MSLFGLFIFFYNVWIGNANFEVDRVGDRIMRSFVI